MENCESNIERVDEEKEEETKKYKTEEVNETSHKWEQVNNEEPSTMRESENASVPPNRVVRPPSPRYE